MLLGSWIAVILISGVILGYGRASAQRLMTPWALMRVGSVSKIITAVSILRLYDEGRLELDSKVFGSEGMRSTVRLGME